MNTSIPLPKHKLFPNQGFPAIAYERTEKREGEKKRARERAQYLANSFLTQRTQAMAWFPPPALHSLHGERVGRFGGQRGGALE